MVPRIFFPLRAGGKCQPCIDRDERERLREQSRNRVDTTAETSERTDSPRQDTLALSIRPDPVPQSLPRRLGRVLSARSDTNESTALSVTEEGARTVVGSSWSGRGPTSVDDPPADTARARARRGVAAVTAIVNAPAPSVQLTNESAVGRRMVVPRRGGSQLSARFIAAAEDLRRMMPEGTDPRVVLDILQASSSVASVVRRVREVRVDDSQDTNGRQEEEDEVEDAVEAVQGTIRNSNTAQLPAETVRSTRISVQSSSRRRQPMQSSSTRVTQGKQSKPSNSGRSSDRSRIIKTTQPNRRITRSTVSTR